ncbi:putative membrane-bound acyltransferase YkrP [Paenibacillus marchantiophytorum]|uniref:Membrane-bound acyltransferase YkrP n=1 Tax=Paenibacillus marchantiophytorum TaxID=1619310 RepID=A0ABQ1FEV6_9BACL|nr:fucose 4-O-acetylase [Paenibacillus marchantiophytorum]GGA09346.1 putative membrane-bound acyltransferase YkrP [Paenibacillus marchantiophytorum]
MDKVDHTASNTFMLNAKFLLILFVVIANCIEPLIQQSPAFHSLYLAIYTFHIPMFVMATGYFSKSFKLDVPGIQSLQMIFYHYLIFQSLYSLLDALAFHAPGVRYSFFIPYSLLWFLFSHFCWRLLLLLFTKLKHPLAISIVLGILIGYAPFTGTMLSFSRTLVFFPFFLAGYYFQLDRVPKLIVRLNKWFSAIGLLGILVLLNVTTLDPKWLYSSFTYTELGSLHWYTGGYRLGIYLLEIVASFCFLSFVPRTPSILTEWGKYTVYVFLLHAFITKTAISLGLFSHVHTAAQMALVLLLAAAMTWLLLQGWVRRFSQPLIEPHLSFWKRGAIRTNKRPQLPDSPDSPIK